MPKRHMNHQIEDASRRKFDTLLPDAWVSRPKASDYGVDVEVELFEEAGSSTGLIFYVQLRGTDDTDRAQKTTLTLEQLDYFNSLDLPTVLVRYCRPTGQVFFKWHFQIKLSPKQRNQNSITVAFEDKEIWTENSPIHIRAVLANLRRLREVRPYETVGLSIVPRSIGASDRFMLESALSSLVSSHAVLTMDPAGGPAAIELRVIANSDSFSFSFGVIGSLTIEVDYSDTDSLQSLIAYGLCAALLQLGLGDHARIVARRLLSDRIITDVEHLGVTAVHALSTRPEDAVELALLNKLQDPTRIAYAEVTIFLLRLSRQHPEVTRSLTTWFVAALEVAETSGTNKDQALIRYNRGNAALNEQAYKRALHDFNRARKLFPEYMDILHFAEGIAGCLYLAKRFRLSAHLYKRAVWLSPEMTSDLAGRLGDACLFAGLVEQAQIAFAVAAPDGAVSLRSMLNALKHDVCEHLVSTHGPSVPRRQSLGAQLLASLDQTDPSYMQALDKLVREVDALNAVARFNLAIESAKAERIEEALFGFLICGFSVPNDDEAWCNAIKCSMKLSGKTMLLVLAAALESNGLKPYKLCREQLVHEGSRKEGLEALDMVVRELRRPGGPSVEFLKYMEENLSPDLPSLN